MRVIAGVARRRPLRAPATKGIRPTGDKIKGVIFSMLEAEAYRRGIEPDPGDEERDGRFAAAVAWPRVLELYAGSGALAIEALSRGAERADLVESDPTARAAIAANLRATGLADRATIHPLRAAAALSTLAGPYDLILLDPPYDEPGISGILERLAAGGRVGRSAVLVWEHGRATVPPDRVPGESAAPEPAAIVWRRVKTNTHGAAAVSLYVAAE
jgi:16S rRNA (guanine966-N2)-methyltransferase